MEKKYRKTLLEKHILSAKLMRFHNASESAIKKEIELISLMWKHYREKERK